MPPRELPGFYFDAERNRYFPLSSRPKPTVSAPSPARSVQTTEGPSRKRRKFGDALSDSGPSRLSSNLSRFGASVSNVKFSHKGSERRHGMQCVLNIDGSKLLKLTEHYGDSDIVAAQYERTAHSTLEMTRIGKGAYITSLSVRYFAFFVPTRFLIPQILKAVATRRLDPNYGRLERICPSSMSASSTTGRAYRRNIWWGLAHQFRVAFTCS